MATWEETWTIRMGAEIIRLRAMARFVASSSAKGGRARAWWKGSVSVLARRCSITLGQSVAS